MNEIIKGKCWIFKDDINTDQIISTRYMLLNSKDEMSKYTFESLYENFHAIFNKGDIIIAGKNFGCGSAREQAPEVLKVLGTGAIIAKSFSPTFYRNSINIGLPVFICENMDDNFSNGDTVTIKIKENTFLTNTNQKYFLKEMPQIIKEIINCSGLAEYYKKYCI